MHGVIMPQKSWVSHNIRATNSRLLFETSPPRVYLQASAMSSPKESNGPATPGTLTNSQTVDSVSSRTVDVVGVTGLTTPDNVTSVHLPPGSTAVESGLFEDKFDSLKSSRGEGSVVATGSEWRTATNVATNSQAMEGSPQPASFESITEAHRSAVVLSPLDKKPVELSPKRRRKWGGSPLAASPELQGTAGKEVGASCLFAEGVMATLYTTHLLCLNLIELAGIASLLDAVPPVSKHFEVLSKIGEGVCCCDLSK